MKEFIDKLIGRLKEKERDCLHNQIVFEKKHSLRLATICEVKAGVYYDAIKICNELAEEYKTSFMQELVEARRNCSEDSDCSQCLFGQIEDRCILAELQIDADIKKNNGWIPCSVQLPEDGQTVIYTDVCGEVYAGHYEKEKNWCVNDSYFPNAFYFTAWMPLPAPYQQKEGE